MEYAAIAAFAAALIGELIGAGKEAEAQKLREDILAEYGPGLLPHLERAEAQTIGRTAYSDITEDATLRNSQMGALRELEDIYANEGMTTADRAAMEMANDQVSARASSDYQNLMQGLARRGIQNSALGTALASDVSQSSANALGTMARQNAVDARGRALRALEAQAGLAGDIRDADWRRLSEVAEAQDRIAVFDAGQRADADRYNLGLAQQGFDNQMLLLQARAAAANGVAGGYERAGQNARQTGAGVGQSFITWGTQKEKGK